jgi:hypothetical protein
MQLPTLKTDVARPWPGFHHVMMTGDNKETTLAL